MQHPSRRGPSQRKSVRATQSANDWDLRPLLGVEEVSQLLGIPKATLYRWHSLSTANTPLGPRAFRVGRYLRYTLEDVRTYIETLRLSSA
ncbi:helix-turn-helix domain-containing protein [Lapillicoccus sp.]|uniref:helix-turn-helix transcriptional regulator n=1 Tax=Lapillicoccus sp. TaxID=1909287 RepID=UPI00326763DF